MERSELDFVEGLSSLGFGSLRDWNDGWDVDFA